LIIKIIDLMKIGNDGLALSNALTAMDLSVAFTIQSTLVFPNLALVSGDFLFTNNAATTASFPVLSIVVGDFIVSHTALLFSFQAAALKHIGGVVSIAGNNFGIAIVFSPLSQVLCEGGFGPESADLQGCARIRASRTITSSPATALTFSLMSYVSGYLVIYSNATIANINLPVLSTVAGDLDFQHNPVLSNVNLLSLRAVGRYLAIYSNPAPDYCPTAKAHLLNIASNQQHFWLTTAAPSS
jgi:hypothetical protein